MIYNLIEVITILLLPEKISKPALDAVNDFSCDGRIKASRYKTDAMIMNPRPIVSIACTALNQPEGTNIKQVLKI